MFLEGTKEGQLAPILIVLLRMTTANMLLEICHVLEHHCDVLALRSGITVKQ